jgi:hypothetical protein
MIGFIALAGIIVRNSMLLVDFTVQQRNQGIPVRDAVILACKARTRPILITAFALVAGSSVILFDPIFQGMAVSLLFGVLVSTLLTLVVIPMGCVTASGPSAPCGGSTTEPPAPAPDEGRKPGETLGKRARDFGATLAHVVPAVGRAFVTAVVGFVATLGMLLKFLASKLTGRRKQQPTPTAEIRTPAPSTQEPVAEEHLAHLEEVKEPAPAPEPIPQKTPGNAVKKKTTAKKKAAARKKAAVKKKTATAKSSVKTTKKSTAAKSGTRSTTTKKKAAPKKAAAPQKKTVAKKTATVETKRTRIKKTAAKGGKDGRTAAKKKERRGIRLNPSKYE